MSTKSKLLWIAKEWPFTKLRPKLQFKNLVQNIHDKSGHHGEVALRSVAAMEELLADKHAKNVSACFNIHPFSRHQYPLSEKITKPASSPTHYAKVLDAVDGKPIHKSFLQRFLRL